MCRYNIYHARLPRPCMAYPLEVELTTESSGPHPVHWTRSHFGPKTTRAKYKRPLLACDLITPAHQFLNKTDLLTMEPRLFSFQWTSSIRYNLLPQSNAISQSWINIGLWKNVLGFKVLKVLVSFSVQRKSAIKVRPGRASFKSLFLSHRFP